MKTSKFFILFLFLINPVLCFSQNYHPLLVPGMTWDAWTLDYSLPACSETGATRVFVNGDSIINSVTYKRISGYSATNITPMPCPVWAFDNSTTFDYAFLREDTSAKQVWLYEQTLGVEMLLFDFGLAAGDTFVTSFGQNPSWPDSMIIDSVYSFQLFDGTFRDMFAMHAINYSVQEFMLEGIGGSAGVYLPPINIGIGFATLMGCVISNNDQLYNYGMYPGGSCPGVIGNTSIITGKAFADLNSNQVYDSGDAPLDYTRITETNTGMFDFTDSLGNFQVYVTDTGNFNVEGAALDSFISTPLSQSAYFGAIALVDSLNDFAYQPVSIFDELQVYLMPLFCFRTEGNASYMVRVKNRGTTNQLPVLIIHQDTVLQFFSSSVSPTTITNDSLVWNLSNLAPFQKIDIIVTFQVDTGLTIGTPVVSTAEIWPVITDAFPLNNTSNSSTHTCGSFDPNDILVDRDTLFDYEMTAPPFLNYLVRFQNTGNDTAFYVRLENLLHQNLDESTLEFVSSSHPLQINWNHLLNRVDFVFDNINLPDSNTNESGSHGFVQYRIRPVVGLEAGDYISNRAAIFFDLNLPVNTNLAWTYISEPTSVAALTPASDYIHVFPNPVGEKLFVRINHTAKGSGMLQVFDTMGRLQLEQKLTGSDYNLELDTENLKRGIYVIRINKGTTSGIKKIIKQ